MDAIATVNGSRVAILRDSIVINNQLSQRISVASFDIFGPSFLFASLTGGDRFPSIGGMMTPVEKQLVYIRKTDGSAYYFAGTVADSQLNLTGIKPRYSLSCQDWNADANTKLVNKTYTTQTEAQIIGDLFGTYWPEVDVASYVVSSGTTYSIVFPNIYLNDALDQLAQITGKIWWVDYSKKLHYLTLASNAAPFAVSDAPTTEKICYNLTYKKVGREIANRVYVVWSGGVEVRTDAASFAKYGRYFDFKYSDTNINTAAWADLVGDAILAEKADVKETGTFSVNDEGLAPGQMVTITNKLRGLVGAQFPIQATTVKLLGGTIAEVLVTYGDHLENLNDKLKKIAQLQSNS